MLVLKENIFFNKLVFLLFFKQKVINIWFYLSGKFSILIFNQMYNF
jgi:hypothetical protein